MADNLIFQIHFDLEKAVNEAGQQWDKKYAKKLEDYINKRPIKVKLDFENLTDVKTRLAQLKIEPITPETKAAIKELARELQVLAKALEQVQKYSRNPTKGAVDASRVALNEEKAKAQAALAAQRAARAEANLAQARLRDARAANIGTAATRDANKAYHEQLEYLQRLTHRMAAYWSIRQVGQFLTNVREVTAEFELQRVSLGAIIQDQNRANQLFSEIKSFALKSPVSILDLTKYTKQLAAYKIGADELFETTKKLTDVSVGLGVSMDRVVLAYGQTRATGYLRASEIRQFTEMGVPIVEELAAKLSKMNGELVTAAQVMDMVSKRGISFELVKEVFDDMTSAGGMFYQMQEKQGNTLYGLWAKLGDAASVMYDQIGNTDSVKNGMKSAIGLLTELMRNWEAIAKTVKWVIIPSAAFAALYKYSTATQRVEAAQAALSAATQRRKAAVLQLSTAIRKGTVDDINAANATLQKAKADVVAAQKATTRMGLLKSGFVSVAKSIGATLGIGLAMGVITALSYKLFTAYENATRLNKELKKIKEETGVEQSRAVINFESLAQAAVNAADGSKEQRNALEELQRTYGNVIPEQDLTIERLKEMKGNYDALTESIKENIRQQQLQKAIDTVTTETENKIIEEERKLRGRLKSTKFKTSNGDEFYLMDNQIDRIVSNFKRLVSAGENASAALQHAFELEQLNDIQYTFDGLAQILGLIEEKTGTTGVYTENMNAQIAQSDIAASGLTAALLKQNFELEKAKKTMGGFNAELGVLGDYLDEAKKKVDEHTFTAKANTFAYDEEKMQVTVEAYMKALQDAFDRANVKIDLNKYIQLTKDGDYLVDWQGLDEALAKLNSKWKVPLQGVAKEVKGIYESFVPADPVVKALKDKALEIATNTKLGKDKMRKHLWDGKVALVDHVKALHEAAEAAKAEIHRYNVYISRFGDVGKKFMEFFGFKIDEKTKEFNAITALLNEEKKYLTASGKESVFGKSKNKGGSKSDPRLQILNEMVQLAEKLNKEYSDWEKKVGSTQALEKVNATYAETVKYAEKVAKDAGISLPHLKTPTNAKELNEYLEAVRKVMETAKGLKGGKKAAIELGVKMSSAVSAEDQKAIEEKIKALADRISRTKTAKEFYDKILSQTGDVELAARVSLQIYGSTGRDLNEQVKEQFAKAFEGLKNDHVDIMPEVNEIIDRGAYEELRDYIALLPEAQRKAAEDLVKAQQQMSVKQYEQWLKDLEKAKTYADKRIELARYTANNIAAIEERIAKLNPQAADYERQKAMLDKLIAGYKSREDKEAAKIEYDMFKDMPLYVQMFDNLDNASSTMLDNMLTLLKKNKAKWGEFLDPTQLKEMQSRMNEIEKQLAARNPFKTLSKSLKDWWALRKSGRNRKDDEDAATKAIEAETAAMERWLAADKAYQAALKAHDNDTENEDVKAAKDKADAAEDEYKKAKETSETAQSQAEAWKKIADNIDNANQKIDEYQDQINKALDEVLSMMDALGVDAIDMEFFNSMKEGFNQILDGSQSAVQAFGQFATGNYFGAAMSSVSAITGIVSGISNLFSAGKVRKANKEIKRQQELLDQLEYTYGRLEASADKLFGRDYLNNYNQQLKVLQAQQQAYLKQAQAERSKGKKADKEKIKEYEKQARDTANAIKEMQDDLAAQIVGTDVASAARDFANAWLDAYLSFGSTTDAIKEKFDDMIKNMIVNMVLAQVVERALKPVFDMIDELAKDGELSAADIAKVFAMVPQSMEDINNGLSVGMEALRAAGVDISKLRDGSSEFSGIAKNIAGATSEEINTAAAIGNTIMYHTSHLPIISQNVAAIYQQISQGKSSAFSDSGAAGWTDWQRQAMENYNAIARNTAETVVECKRAADACAAATEKLNGAFRAKGAIKGFNVFLNS